MTKKSIFKPVSVRGLIRNFRNELVPIEDDVQYAEVFEVQAEGTANRVETLDALNEELLRMFEEDGTLAGADTDSDVKHAVRSRFEKGVSDFIVEKVVESALHLVQERRMPA
jgi:hypothetical protein